MPTKIQRTDETWNPTTGCSKIATGCLNCYAEKMTARLKAMDVKKYAAGFDKVVCHRSELDKPLHWRKPRRVFVDSMSDLFHKDVPDRFIAQVFYTMACAKQHTFQVLTKRPERAVVALAELGPVWEHAAFYQRESDYPLWPLPNFHLGVSVSTQADANKNIPILLKCPAAKRIVSAEPLLEEIDFDVALPCGSEDCNHGEDHRRGDCGCSLGIDQLILGGESGPGARPCDIAWIRSGREQCKAAGVACFVKQLGANAIAPGPHRKIDYPQEQWWPERTSFTGDSNRVQLKHPKGADPTEWPEDLANARKLI